MGFIKQKRLKHFAHCWPASLKVNTGLAVMQKTGVGKTWWRHPVGIHCTAGVISSQVAQIHWVTEYLFWSHIVISGRMWSNLDCWNVLTNGEFIFSWRLWSSCRGQWLSGNRGWITCGNSIWFRYKGLQFNYWRSITVISDDSYMYMIDVWLINQRIFNYPYWADQFTLLYFWQQRCSCQQDHNLSECLEMGSWLHSMQHLAFAYGHKSLPIRIPMDFFWAGGQFGFSSSSCFTIFVSSVTQLTVWLLSSYDIPYSIMNPKMLPYAGFQSQRSQFVFSHC